MMNKLDRSLKGVSRVKISGVFPETVLNACAMEAIEIWDMESPEEYTLSFSLPETELEMLRTIAARCMCNMDILETQGGSERRRFVKRHVWLMAFCGLILSLLMLSSLFIWDIKIYGCKELSRGEILRALAECGVDCGTYWPGIKNDLVRSEMMLRLPKLAWMSVNVNGSRAAVLVVERVEKPEIYSESQGADIVSKGAGIIRRVSVLNGKSLAEIGDSVLKGEPLVSGRLESLSREPRLVRARGEIIADTWYDISSVSPAQMDMKTDRGAARRRFALQIGGKRINLYFGGRKDVDEWEKEVHNYILGIEGVFALPIVLVAEKYIPCERNACPVDDADAMGKRLLESLENSIDGEIISHSLVCGQSDGLNVVTLRAACREDIGSLMEYTSAAAPP